MPIVFVGAAALLSFAMLRPDPYQLADRSPDEDLEATHGSTAASLASVLRRPHVSVAVVALVVGQVVMVLIMTMTPIHMTMHGHGLGEVGMVISGHTFGMFGLSPISGRLTDRFGSPAVIFAGLVTIAVSSVMAAVAPPDGGVLLFLALFLLGLRLEPGLRRRFGAPDDRSGSGRADAPPGLHRRADLELGGGREPDVRDRARDRRLRHARAHRGRDGHRAGLADPVASGGAIVPATVVLIGPGSSRSGRNRPFRPR